MSRLVLVAVVLWFHATKLFSTDLPLQEDLGTPFRQPGVPIVWNTTLDGLPHSAMVFRVVSKQYSLATMSNLLAITEFSASNRVFHVGFGNRVLYRDPKNEDRSLCIFPDDGLVLYRNPTAIASPKEPVECVPLEEEAYKMAETIVFKLGIDRQELVTKRGTQELYRARTVGERGVFDKTQRKLIKTVHSRGLWFVRRIDGIDSGAFGGRITFNFGNNGQLADLDWIWRALKPYRLIRVATRTELTDWIRGGRCVLDGWQEFSISALNITNATPYYFEKRGDEPQKYVYPYVQLDAQAKLSDTNIPVCLYCPWIAE